MKSLYICALTCALSLLWSCGPSYIKPVDASQESFAVSFFKSVNASTPKGENVVVSPYSAAVTLSMLAEGAQGQTRVEFDNALGGVLYKAENLGSNDTVVVKSANSVWIDNDFSPRNRYVSLLDTFSIDASTMSASYTTGGTPILWTNLSHVFPLPFDQL